MTLYDISGNEIHDKEVVFEYTMHVDDSAIKSVLTVALDKPETYSKVVFLGSPLWSTHHYFAAYKGTDLIACRIYLGQLKDK